MPGLPDRPDLDQLRRQARELLRAAAAGEPHAAGRLSAVSPRATLSAAQLALAREYGFPNWAALKAEVARRRLSATPADRWSFGGAAELQTPAGILLPEILIAGAGHAALYGTVTMSGNGQPAGSASRRRGPSRAALLARLRVQPVPAPGTAWLELHGTARRPAAFLRHRGRPARGRGPAPEPRQPGLPARLLAAVPARLDPLARAVRLTFRGAREEVTADLELGTIRPER